MAKRSRDLSSPTDQPTNPPDVLDILMITPEARPFAKTGGLADVAAALPQALARLGHHVTVVLPRYRGIDTAGFPSQSADVPFGAQTYPVVFVEAQKKGDNRLFSQKKGTTAFFCEKRGQPASSPDLLRKMAEIPLVTGGW
jgi:hypothetical protein